MPARLLAASHPIVISEFEGLIAPEEMQAYLRELTKLVEGPPFALIVVTKKLRRVGREIAVLQSDWFKAHWEACQRQWLGIAFVFDSALPRFGLTALLLLTRLPMPHMTTDKYQTGLDWACDALRRRQLSLPNPLPAPS